MDAEYYMDFDQDYDDPRDAEPYAKRVFANTENRRFRYLKNLAAPYGPHWTTGQGESIPIHEMEDSHIANTLNYINRRIEEWNRTCERASRRNNVQLGSIFINNKPAVEWFGIFTDEIIRRQRMTSKMNNSL